MGESTWAEMLQVPLAGADSCSAAVAFAAKISFQLASRRYACTSTSVWSLGLVCTFTRPDTDPIKCSWMKSSNARAEKYLQYSTKKGKCYTLSDTEIKKQ